MIQKIKDSIKGIFDFVKPLVCENGYRLSIGRVGLWVCLYKIWTIVEITTETNVTDIPSNMLLLTIVFITYNFSKKVDEFERIIKAWRGTNKEDA